MKIQLRRGTSTEWTQVKPVLAAGEVGVETDTLKFKVGDGAKAWDELDYQGVGSGDFTQCRPLLIGDASDNYANAFVPPETHRASQLDTKRLVLNAGAASEDGDLGASFGGIVLKGFRDHFWLYDYANNAWNTSDNINLSCETGILIDNKKALDEDKVRVGNRVKGGKVYLGSGEHNSWRLGTDKDGNLIAEYRKLDGQWVTKALASLTAEDTSGIEVNMYQEKRDEPAKKPGEGEGTHNFWPKFESANGNLKVTLDLTTDDAVAMGRIVKRSMNFNGYIAGPLLKVKPGDTLEVEFKNSIEDLGEIEPWNDGMMQGHEMLHSHVDDRGYPGDGGTLGPNGVIWMSHIMQRGSTNLHFHGSHVTPSAFGDNVMRTSKPGSKLRYYYEIPSNHFGGLMWMHPHGHGGSMNALSRGAALPVLIEGPYQERLNAAGVDREYMILQRMQWGDNLNGHDELNWVDYVSNLQPDMYDPEATPTADGQKVSGTYEPTDLSPYYKDNVDPKCICTCAALEGGAPHVHGNTSMANPSCTPVDVRWVPTINGQKRPKYSVQQGELKIFSALNASGITFYRVGVKDHDIVIVGRDGIPREAAPGADLSAAPVSPDFVDNQAGIRLDYFIINPGQRFEFFVIPKAGVEVAEGDYPIYMKPVTEVETFDSLDADVQMGAISYTSSILSETADNHVSKLADLLPSSSADGSAVPTQDKKALTYIADVAELESLLGSTPKVATVSGAESDGAGKIIMPGDAPHHLEVGHEVRIGGTAYTISALDADAATFHVNGTPAAGSVDFEYNLYKTTTVNNNAHQGEIVEVLTDHYFYRGIEFPVEAFSSKIVRQRKFSFAIHGRGLAGMGANSTWMNESPYNDFNRTVSYLGTNEEFLMENKSDVIHLFHIHVNEYQIVGYRDGVFGANLDPADPRAAQYSFGTEIDVAGKCFEDTSTIPAGVLADGAEEAAAGSRGEVRMRTTYADYTGLFLMHCHLLDDQDMGMMQHIEVVAPGYEQAPYVGHNHG